MLMFNCPSAEETIHKTNLKFLNKYATADNLCVLFADIAVCHCDSYILLLLLYAFALFFCLT